MQKSDPPKKGNSLSNGSNWIGICVIVAGYNHYLEGQRGTVTRVVQTQFGLCAVVKLYAQEATTPFYEYTIEPDDLVEEM